jgi:hypothetical protein
VARVAFPTRARGTLDPDDPEDGFTISYMDDAGEQFFVEGVGECLVPEAVEQAIADGGACKIMILRQGDEADD